MFDSPGTEDAAATATAERVTGNASRKAYLVGGGIGSLAAAAFMIRDGHMTGANITLFEAGATMGGSLDGGGNAKDGYSLRGGRMLTFDNYECTWDLFESIPSLARADQSVFAETVAFHLLHPSHAQARLVDRHRAIVPVHSMGFDMKDRIELLKLAEADEETLGDSVITHWLSPPFFETSFWFMWATTFAFQPWHSALEFKRYLHRFMLEFTRIETLGGVRRTVYNQYDSMVLPLQRWLADRGVRMLSGCHVDRLDHRPLPSPFRVTGIGYRQGDRYEIVEVRDDDLVLLQNGSMTDASSLGSMTAPPPRLTRVDSGGWDLWERLAEGRPEFGRPAAFNRSIAQSCWESFTVTLRDPVFFDAMHRLSGNEAGTGGLVTFKDSAWLMSIVLAHQPHFADQPEGVQVFWGYALLPDRVGDFVAKPMADCNGAEILEELRGHLRLDDDGTGSANCIPCRMPYITSMFMPREKSDRPLPIPCGTRNFAFVSQFVELETDVVFTVEYSIRAAQTAVYGLLGIERTIPPITPQDQAYRTRFATLVKAFA